MCDNKFNMKQWKNNCFEMYECADFIYKFIKHYINKVNAMFINMNKLSNEEYPLGDYYKYLTVFYWHKYVIKNIDKEYGFKNFEEKYDKFINLYNENADMYKSMDTESKINLSFYEDLTKNTIHMYYGVDEESDYYIIQNGHDGYEEYKKLFFKLNELINSINKINHNINIINNDNSIINDTRFMPMEMYIFSPNRLSPVPLRIFTDIKYVTIEKLKNYADENAYPPTVTDIITRSFIEISNFIIYYEIKDYFKKLSDDFNSFINKELIKNVKYNLSKL